MPLAAASRQLLSIAALLCHGSASSNSRYASKKRTVLPSALRPCAARTTAPHATDIRPAMGLPVHACIARHAGATSHPAPNGRRTSGSPAVSRRRHHWQPATASRNAPATAAVVAHAAHDGALGSTAASGSDDADGAVHVWILAGQSNTVGDNSFDGQPMPDAGRAWPGRLLSFGPIGQWQDAEPNLHMGTHDFQHRDSVGPDMAFGRALLRLGACSRVGFVPAARGGTSLYRDWQPGGRYYRFMMQRARAALAAAPPPLPALPSGSGRDVAAGTGTAAPPACRLAGVIWVHGETDGYEGTADQAAAYGCNFRKLVEAMRHDLAEHHPQLPVVMGVMPTRGRDYAHIDVIRKQQLALELPGLVKVDIAGYEFFEQFGGQLVHLSKAGACALGAAMAHVYYANVLR